jgi:hypothetical protein
LFLVRIYIYDPFSSFSSVLFALIEFILLIGV